MKDLKLNKLAKNRLNEKEMNELTGGAEYWGYYTIKGGKVTAFVAICGCACAYANSGGSSTGNNKEANAGGGKFSPGT